MLGLAEATVGLPASGGEHARDAAAVLAVAVGAELRVAETAPRAVQVDRCCQWAFAVGHGQVVLAGRQGLQVAGDGQQIVVAEVLGAVVDDIGHAAGHRGEAVLPGLQQLHGVLHRPQVAQAQGLPLFDGFSGEVELPGTTGFAHGFFLEGDAARSMAGAAVAEPLYQVGAAVDHRVRVAGGGERRVVEERPVPQRQAPALVERPAHRARRIRLGDGLHAVHQVGVQRTHVFFADLGVGRVGHRRIEIHSLGGHPLAHGAVELFEAVAADAGLPVGSDVGRVDGTHWRLQLQAAGHRRALRAGMAGDAVAELGHVAAFFDERSVRGRFAGMEQGNDGAQCAEQAEARERSRHFLILRRRPGAVPSATVHSFFRYAAVGRTTVTPLL